MDGDLQVLGVPALHGSVLRDRIEKTANFSNLVEVSPVGSRKMFDGSRPFWWVRELPMDDLVVIQSTPRLTNGNIEETALSSGRERHRQVFGIHQDPKRRMLALVQWIGEEF